MHCAEYKDLVAAHVDGLLAAEEEALAAAHLASCPQCARLLERERHFTQALRARRFIRPMPADARQRLLALIEAEDQSGPTVRLRQWRLQPAYRAALAGAVALLVLAVVVPLLRSRVRQGQDVLHDVLAQYRDAQAQAMQLEVRTDKPEELAQYYQRTGVSPSTEIVMDLRALGYRLMGGSVVQLGTAKSTMTLYHGERGWLLCHRFLAADLQLPAGGEVVDGDTYYRVDGLTVCTYRDGNVTCLMASTMSRDEFIKLMAGYA